METIKIKVKVKTNAKIDLVEVTEKDFLKVSTKASPVDNKANKALQKILAKHYNVPKSSVLITKGASSSTKIYEITLND